MRGGPLRQRVTLQTLSETADDFGQSQPTWTDVGTYWASIRGTSSREVAIAQQLQAQVTHSVTMRNVGTITPKDRLVFNGRTLNIVQVINKDERNRELWILCVEAV